MLYIQRCLRFYRTMPKGCWVFDFHIFYWRFLTKTVHLYSIRLLQFQVQEDKSNPVNIIPERTSLVAINSPPKKKSLKERRGDAAKLKGASVKSRDFLHPALFTNFQYLIPDMQIMVLDRIKCFYNSKQDIIADVGLFFPMSVSFICWYNVFFSPLCPIRTFSYPFLI